jgi:hypothetical protein
VSGFAYRVMSSNQALLPKAEEVLPIRPRFSGKRTGVNLAGYEIGFDMRQGVPPEIE